jgi:hypothetical protein
MRPITKADSKLPCHGMPVAEKLAAVADELDHPRSAFWEAISSPAGPEGVLPPPPRA